MVEYFVGEGGIIYPVYDRISSPFENKTSLKLLYVDKGNYKMVWFVDTKDDGRIDYEYVLHSSLKNLAELIED